MRRILYGILSASAEFKALIPAERILEASAVTQPPDLSQGMWCSVRMLPLEPGIKPDGALNGAGIQHVQLWIYDKPGSYEAIDNALRVAKAAITAAPPRAYADVGLQCAEWEGDSPDLPAPEYGAIVRNGSYRLVGSGV